MGRWIATGIVMLVLSGMGHAEASKPSELMTNAELIELLSGPRGIPSSRGVYSCQSDEGGNRLPAPSLVDLIQHWTPVFRVTHLGNTRRNAEAWCYKKGSAWARNFTFVMRGNPAVVFIIEDDKGIWHPVKGPEAFSPEMRKKLLPLFQRDPGWQDLYRILSQVKRAKVLKE